MPLSSEHAHVFPLPLPLLKAPLEFLLLDYLFDHTLLQPLCLLSCIVDVLRLHLYQKTVPRIRTKKLTVVSISFLEDFKEELMHQNVAIAKGFHPNTHRLVKSKIVPHNRVIFFRNGSRSKKRRLWTIRLSKRAHSYFLSLIHI